jgi:anti-anti-sigma factor
MGAEEGGAVTLSITMKRLDDGSVEISPRGEVDASNATTIRQAVEAALAEARPRRIRLDLREVTLLDSAGIGILVACHGAAAEHGAMFVVTNPSPIIHRQLRVSGIAALVGKP